MDFASLGTGEIRVSRLTLGCEALGGTDWGDYEIADVVRAIDAAWELGINAFDVADVYGLGLAEERLASALGARRHDAVLITKFGVAWEGGGPGRRARIYSDASPEHLREALSASLRRLRVDCIPVYLVHRPDSRIPLDVTLEGLERCRAEGKIRCYGLSNFTSETVGAAFGRPGLAALENQYSLVDRRCEALFSEASRRGVGVLAYGTLAHGFLTGKYSAESRFPESDRRHRQEVFSEEGWRCNKGILESLRGIAGRLGRPCAQVALRWALGGGIVTSAIVGAKSAEQVADLVSSLSCPLTDGDREVLSASKGHTGPT